MTMYADDTSLCHQSHDLTQLNEAINSDLSKLETWLLGNKFSLNVAKTHSKLISIKQKHNSLESRNEALELKIRDNGLEVVQKTKYLAHMETQVRYFWVRTFPVAIFFNRLIEFTYSWTCLLSK